MQGRQDVWNTVVHPRLVGVPMVFPWGPCSRVGEETGSDVHEVRECRIIFWFASKHEGASCSVVRTVRFTLGVGRLTAGGAVLLAMGLKPP